MPVMRPLRPRATIADVARQAGVSTATVSRVLNGLGPVAPATASAVWAAVAELSYAPHAAARSLARGRSNILSLLLPQIGSAYFTPLVRGVEGAAREAGFDLLVLTSARAGQRGVSLRQRIAELNSDGILVFAHSLDHADLEHLHRLHMPMVLLLQPAPDGLAIPCVNLRNRRGARAMTEHLIEVHGYRRIAFLRGPEGNSDSAWREMGYREALAAHGIAFDEGLVATGAFEQAQARASVEAWLQAGVRPEAIFAGDDDSAYGAMQAVQHAGLRVPQDIAVVGFDGLDFTQYLSPPLTTVRAPIEEAGRRGAELLIEVIRSGHAAEQVLLPTELVVRQSCGCGTQKTLQ